jgi:hypothetical protein
MLMGKADAGAKVPAPFAIRDAPMEIGELDLSAWLPPAPNRTSSAAASSTARGADRDGEILAALAIEAWRLKGQLARLRELLPDAEQRAVESAVGKMEELLRQASVELEDPKGRLFREGELLEALRFEPSPGLSQPTVLQTIRPLVRVGGQPACRGQVVVGTPIPADRERQGEAT